MTRKNTYSRHCGNEVEQVFLEIFSAATNDSTANNHKVSIIYKRNNKLVLLR